MLFRYHLNFYKLREKRQLKYLGGLAKNRKIAISISENSQQTIRLDELAQSLSKEDFTKV
jgi:hypothetical protein